MKTYSNAAVVATIPGHLDVAVVAPMRRPRASQEKISQSGRVWRVAAGDCVLLNEPVVLAVLSAITDSQDLCRKNES